uniref:Uncharacterized protein n=1 Tax=Leptocylindrus danicus TaxID=163516 RepID=A0A7S2KCY6_9STRA
MLGNYNYTSNAPTSSNIQTQQEKYVEEDIASIASQLPSCVESKENCRYDDVGDFLESRVREAVIHEPLPCVPSHRRIPHSKANDWPYILHQREIPPQDGSMTALMDYNAMLLPLYRNTEDGGITSDLDPVLLDRLTGRFHSYFTDEDVDRVEYLSISRTSNLHSCKPRFKFYFGTTPQDFLGLSLLDENLKRIEGTDVAVNVDKWLLADGQATFFDFQIVAARSTMDNPLRDQLFMFATGHLGTFFMPIDIRRMPPISEGSSSSSSIMDLPWESKLSSRPVPPSSEYQYGDGIQIRFMDNPGLVPRRSYFNFRGVDRGKNFHVFESKDGDALMEVWPYGKDNAHHVTPIDFFGTKFEPGTKFEFFVNRTNVYAKGHRYEIKFENLIKSKAGTPKPSFINVTPKHERPYKKYRGTSQLIDMKLNNTDVKVGISHTVHGLRHENSTAQRTYLSQFYAFLPYAPFETVAVTGNFCFKHMDEHDTGYSAQWISQRPIANRTSPNLIMWDEVRCPRITFATGMAEMIGNGGKDVIITYGVDDCYSRSIIVPKKKIEMLLLGTSNAPNASKKNI